MLHRGAAQQKNSACLHALSPSCRMFSYLDDIMTLAPLECAGEAMRPIADAPTRHGLVANPTRTQAWSAGWRDHLIGTVRTRWVGHF
eukprot:127129-Pyramimonas_sp.AAC.1